jgi:hypothetical protein
MLPEAVSEALGIDLSEMLSLYFGELDNVRRGQLIGVLWIREGLLKRVGNGWLRRPIGEMLWMSLYITEEIICSSTVRDLYE